MTGCITSRAMQPDGDPAGSRTNQIPIQKNPRLIGLKRPTWGVEPGIGTTINAGVQSACGRQRSTAGEVVAPLVRLPKGRRARVMAPASRNVSRLARRRAVKRRRGLKLFERNARVAPSDPPKSGAAKPGIADSSTGQALTGERSGRQKPLQGKVLHRDPPVQPERTRLTIGRRYCS